MLNGLSKDKAEQYLKPYAPSLLDFVQAIYADTEGHDDGEAGRAGCCLYLSAAAVAAR